MKNSIVYIIAVSALFAACTKSANISSETSLVFGMPETEVRTVLGAKSGSSYPVFWSEGDLVSVNGNLSSAVTSADAGKASVTLQAKVGTAPYNTLFPGAAGVTDEITIPATQSYVANSCDPAALPMYATGNSLNSAFQLNFLAALVKVQLTGITEISSVKIASVGGENVGGTFTVGKTSGALNGNLTATSGVTSVTLKAADPVRLNETGATAFYVAIAPGTYSKGLKVTVTSDEPGLNKMVFEFAKTSNTISKGKVYELPVLTFTAQQ